MTTPRTAQFHELTDDTALTMLTAAVAMARQIDVPECIVIVDMRGRTIASLRMTGAKFLSLASATAKAVTAASGQTPSGGIPEQFENLAAHATSGELTNLRGGLPVFIEGNACGAIGVGSGSPDQDLQVANAALAAVGADPQN